MGTKPPLLRKRNKERNLSGFPANASPSGRVLASLSSGEFLVPSSDTSGHCQYVLDQLAPGSELQRSSLNPGFPDVLLLMQVSGRY
ncbi:hypothetical protein Y1Q_0012005 [Alligator mississippiensis]|uniref:Uncharacterized protein n=1 Tax=Alligator mississippiensis TaxID=8496 RepID=A0A151NGZ7_ALLMI|nr:hypothetical protein Y1Q_0012005 [Alligator mississippiensis]